MADLDWKKSCRDVFVEWKIQTVINIYILEVIISACSMRLHHINNNHHYNTRRAYDFHLPVHHSKRFEHKPSYSGAKLFNILPEEIKRSKPKDFKTNCYKWLLQHPFYNVNEFLNWPTL